MSRGIYLQPNKPGAAVSYAPVLQGIDCRRSAARMLGVTTTASSKFVKSRRLLKHADFQRVYQNGRRQFTGNMTVFFLRRDGNGEEPRVGFTVGRVLGGAVERNRIKRRMREAVRTSWQVCHGPIDVVFNPRKSVLELPFADLKSEVERGLRLAVQRARTAPADSIGKRQAESQ